MQDYEKLRKELTKEVEEHARTRETLAACETLVDSLRAELERERAKPPPPAADTSRVALSSTEQVELVAQCRELEKRCASLQEELDKKVLLQCISCDDKW